ncbi:ATP:Cob(I)alamin adenosyltransferase [invertebrate metagenome]|uniref:ATP:Cob(I)alamin adenosyltransferase n=1 Tax=invertebrate metagenome TaxID=1711999 RepID=A0A484H6G5_9ZZZZ
MVQLTRIYTRGGDKGKTSLSTGKRVPKHDMRVQTYGTVDETNAIIGLARLYTRTAAPADAMLMQLQNDLFDLGADLCTPIDLAQTNQKIVLRIAESQVNRLEREIDAMNAHMPPLHSFILPGGTAAAAHLHHARTVCRRAERLLVELAEMEQGGVNSVAIQYLNRLSDHLFVLARHVNDHGKADVLWIPGGNCEREGEHDRA